MEKIEKMYDKIRTMLDNRINSYTVVKKNLTPEDSALLIRLLKIQELMSDESNNLFINISMDVAYKVLLDIGIEQEDLNLVYTTLIKENDRRYILIDPNNLEKKI